jgi:RimJ/RimL family protein N-acetyltransferase
VAKTPGTVVLTGPRVTLRAFDPGEVDAALEGQAGVEELNQPRTKAQRERYRRTLLHSGRLRSGRIDFAIDVGGRVIGDCEARTGQRILPDGVFELGIAIFSKNDRGKGHGSEAVELLTAWLFDDQNAVRVQAGTAVTNSAMRHTFEKLGFTCEGVMRSFLPGADSHVDCALYAQIRADRPSS